MRWAVLVFLLGGGCDQAFGLSAVTDATPGDAVVAPDAPIDGATPCYGRNGPGNTGLFQYCTSTSAPFPTLSTTMFNTDQDPICAPDAAAACVVVAPVIDIVGTVTAVGSRPLVLIATTTLTVMGTIDVSSQTTALDTAIHKGAGADDAGCIHPAPIDESSGGPGGTFGTGGGGGGGRFVTAAAPIATVDRLRGGCPGSTGTIGDDASAGAGGASGGAVYLIAGTSITIGTGAFVNASGAFGFGGPRDLNENATPGGGGGGGGAGGLIGFDAPTVTIAGLVMADGAGGGGGGAGSNPNGDGTPGSTPPTSLAPALGGSGGSGNPAGADGGAGCAGMAGAGSSASTSAAGGGGGGGCGVIRVYAGTTTIGKRVSPPPS